MMRVKQSFAGIENFEDPSEAEKVAGEDPDHYLRDLYNAIGEADGYVKKYPSWTFYIQTMTPEQAGTQKFNPFDITKVSGFLKEVSSFGITFLVVFP